MLDVGDTVTLAAPAVLDTAGQPANATTVALVITLPDGTSSPQAPANPPATTGLYTHPYVIAQHGRHVARWTFTGGVPDQAYADAFNAADPTWPAIVGLAETKRHLKHPPEPSPDDEDLRGAILCVSQVVEDLTGEIVRRQRTVTYSGFGDTAILLRHRPVISVDSVVVDGQTVDPAEYTFSPAGVLARKWGRWPRGMHNVDVTTTTGRVAAAPATVDAALELIRINWRPREGGNYSVFDGEGGDDFGVSRAAEGSLQGEIRLGFFIPNTVMQRLQPTIREPHVG